MNSILKYISFFLFLALLACKKDTGPVKDIPVKEPSERFKFITSHYWRLAEKWQDTTAYGKAHPELIPLPSSTNVYVFTDSCQYKTSSKFSIYSQYYTVKPYGCSGCGTIPSCEVFENRPWSLSSDESTFYGPYDVTNILIVNDSVFKDYQFVIYNFNKKMIELYVRKAYVYN